MTNECSPSTFADVKPFNSVTQKSECETIAKNIMTILSRTGNTFRPLEWDEYKAERIKDGKFTEGEKCFFGRVIGFCKSQDTAVLFASVWKAAAEAAERKA